MIEIQLSPENYGELKSYAAYASDLTRVCAFEPELKEFLLAKGIELEKADFTNHEAKVSSPVLSIQGRNIMKVIGADMSLEAYLDITSSMDPTISIFNMHEVRNIIRSKIVEVDDKFKSVYPPIKNPKDSVKTLLSGKIKTRYGVLSSIAPDFQTIKDMKFIESEKKAMKVSYRQMTLTVVEPFGKRVGNKSIMLCHENSTGKDVYINVHGYLPSMIKTMSFVGNSIYVASPKVKVQDKFDILDDPIFLPRGMDLIRDSFVRSPTRSIPAVLYRAMYDEFQLRATPGELYTAKEIRES